MSGHGVKWFRGSLIGRGSFASVYIATLKKPKTKSEFLPMVLAVKSAEVSECAILQKEKEVLEEIRGSPYVIDFFGEEITHDECSGQMTYNLLFEYASGGTLGDAIKDLDGCGVPESVAIEYTKSIVRGLVHIHDCGYVHCDLKPENILLVSPQSGSCVHGVSYIAKIGDLGLAKKEKRQKKRREGNLRRGTHSYMAPETVVDKVQGPPSDIWALGCVVFRMLTGMSIWAEEDTREDIWCSLSNKCWIPEIPNGISNDARSFLKACFVRNPMFRFTAEMLMDHPFLASAEDDA